MRKIVTILVICTCVVVVIMFFPVKLAIHISKIEVSDEIYLCKKVSSTGASWQLVGDQNGLWSDNDIENVIIEGFEPQKELSPVILNEEGGYNIFVIYGQVVDERYFDEYSSEIQKVISCKKWGIVYPVLRGDSMRVFTPKAYLSISDFNWFRD